MKAKYQTFKLIKLLLLHLSLAYSLILPISANAQIGEVKINGETFNPEYFDIYKRLALGDVDYCFPNIDVYATNELIATKLILDAGIAEEINRDGELDSIVLSALEQVNNSDKAIRTEAFKELFFRKSGSYRTSMMGRVEKTEKKALYQKMLEAKDPLLINATWVRTASLAFDTFVKANQALERLQRKEPFEAVAADLGFDSEYDEELKTKWIHEAHFPKREGETTPKTDDILGPFYMYADWQIRLVLDSEVRPITLYDDAVDGYQGDTELAMQSIIKQERYKALVSRLWTAAKVEIDGIIVTGPTEIYCDETNF